jgi:hypothetical protein
MTTNRNRLDYTIGKSVETQPDWFKRILGSSIVGPHPEGQIYEVLFLITNEQAIRMIEESKAEELRMKGGK